MRREDRRRKFHDAVISTLHPHASPSTSPIPSEDEEDRMFRKEDAFDFETLRPEDFVGINVSVEDGEEEPASDVRPSRAQRKKIRRKKLKEEACRRGNLIGPLLPQLTTAEMKVDGANSNGPGTLNRITEKNASILNDELGEKVGDGDGNRERMRRRRAAKREARAKAREDSTRISVSDRIGSNIQKDK